MKVLVARVNETKVGWNEDITNLIEYIAERCDAVESVEEAEHELMSCIDDELIYDSDKWAVMMAYQRPCEANWEAAIEQFVIDCEDAIEWVVEESPF